jgi:hypothetical protein
MVVIAQQYVKTMTFLITHGSMKEAVVPTVNKETKIDKHFHTHSADLDVGHHKTPSDVTMCSKNFGVQAVRNSCNITYFHLVRFFFFYPAFTTLYEFEPPHSRGSDITHKNAPQSIGLLWMSDQPVAKTST